MLSQIQSTGCIAVGKSHLGLSGLSVEPPDPGNGVAVKTRFSRLVWRCEA
jgi:hypothetical protein